MFIRRKMCFALLLQLLLILELELRAKTRIKCRYFCPISTKITPKKINKALQYQHNEKYL